MGDIPHWFYGKGPTIIQLANIDYPRGAHLTKELLTQMKQVYS